MELEIGRRQRHVLLIGEVADEFERHGVPCIEPRLTYLEVEFHQRGIADIHRHRSHL